MDALSEAVRLLAYYQVWQRRRGRDTPELRRWWLLTGRIGIDARSLSARSLSARAVFGAVLKSRTGPRR